MKNNRILSSLGSGYPVQLIFIQTICSLIIISGQIYSSVTFSSALKMALQIGEDP